jgi:hypothetical protein
MFTIVMPMDTNRLEQFKNTKRVYDTFPEVKEFIIPTRSHDELLAYMTEHKLLNNVRLIPYTHEIGFNPSKALNIGVRNATYDNIIITSPEIMPKTQVLEQLTDCVGKNVVCQVFDQDKDGNLKSLVNKKFRSGDPGMYFLALFNKKDIEVINGWDEDFMLGYAYEDNDFGKRWVRAGLPFQVRDDIQAVHQYHPRTETIHNGASINFEKMNWNTDHNVIACNNGLKNIVQ